MAGKIKGLQQWCQRMTNGYRDVHMKDFTTSWRDGLAFCAIIHRFRPDLIDYDSLSKENVFDNNNLAFSVAERELDIPAFLEAADMVALRTPDKLSVITYVSQYYNKLSALPQLGGPGVQGKKTTPAAPATHGVKRHQPAEPLSEPEPKKQPPAKKIQPDTGSSGKVKTLGDRCAICSNKVYLLERHVEDGKLYHRSCFRHSDLSPSNKVYTRSPFLSPSLHGKDSGAASPTGGRASPNFPSKLQGGDEKQGTKRHADEVGSRDTGSKSEVRKFLFSKDGDTKNKHEEKSAVRDSGLGRKDFSKDKQVQPDRPNVASKLESKVVSPPQTHSSMDFMSAGTTAEDSKSAKRQLPLIFQAAGSADNGADKTTKGAGNKTSLFSQNKIDSAPKSCDLSAKQAPNSANSVTAGKSHNDKSSHSVFSGSQPGKSVSESKVTEKNAGPVAKPRQIGAKVLPGASDLKLEKDKSSAFPKPRPRTAVLGTETSDKLEKTKSPPVLRKGPARPKSPPSRELSPPPLPSSAPPPLPQSSPIPPSSQHLAKPSSPQASPRRQSTPVTASQHLTSSSEEKAKSGFSLFGKKKASGVSSPRHEEPMDMETAFKEARSQYGEEPVAVMVVPASNKEQEDKTVVSGLLKSLAHVRNTGSPNTSTTMSSSSVTQPALSGAKTSSSHSSAVTENSSASSSSTITLGHTKDGDHKSPLASGNKEKKSDESSGKLRFSLSFFKSGDTSHKDAEAQKNSSKSSDTSSDKTVPVMKLGEAMTITLNTKKTENSASKPAVSVLSKQDEKSSERVPLYKKKAESNPANKTNRPGDSPRGTPGKDVASGTRGAFGAKKDRPKSAAIVLGGKELSTHKLASASADGSPTPLFTQVKLRDSSQSALERKDRPKSAGILLDNSADSRPSWQQEAERKKAVYRDSGFVDPETKKAVGKTTENEQTPGSRASPVEDTGVGKLEKNNKREPPPRPAPFHSPASESWQKEGKILLAKTTDVKKRSDENKAEGGSTFKHNSSTPGPEQPSPAVHVKKKEEKSLFGGGLKGILKGKHKETPETTTSSPPPVKPERHLHNKEKQQTEVKSLVESLKGSDSSAPSKASEETATKKKISVSRLKDDRDQTVTPPPSEDFAGRKKITVDINFDFNMSSSMEASGQLTSSRTTEKATPPSRPPPPHRTSMSPGRLSAIELQKQLLDIDSKLSELELRGRTLEDSIRSEESFQCPHDAVPQASMAAEEEDEDLMMEWFQLVSEKNELVRQECDLVYMSREQDLEDEQSQIESQLRYLLTKEENDKSFEEKEEEEYLIQRKVQIVNQRNSIVECIDEDRLRYEEEDRDIAQMLQDKGFIKDGNSPPQGKDKGKAAERRMKVGSSLFYT